jgi:hypothetical protein
VGLYNNTMRMFSLDPGSVLQPLAVQQFSSTPESVRMLYNSAPGDAGEGDLFLHAGLSNGVLQWTQVRVHVCVELGAGCTVHSVPSARGVPSWQSAAGVPAQGASWHIGSCALSMHCGSVGQQHVHGGSSSPLKDRITVCS